MLSVSQRTVSETSLDLLLILVRQRTPLGREVLERLPLLHAEEVLDRLHGCGSHDVNPNCESRASKIFQPNHQIGSPMIAVRAISPLLLSSTGRTCRGRLGCLGALPVGRKVVRLGSGGLTSVFVGNGKLTDS